MVALATKTARVVPNDKTSWTGLAVVYPLPSGNPVVVPISVANGNQTVDKTSTSPDTHIGQAFVYPKPAAGVDWVELPVVETNGPILIVPVGTAPYTNGVVVLFV